MKALWRPAWYQLDHSLELGAEDSFEFCATYPAGVPPGFDLVFHNSLLGVGEPIERRFRIADISHPWLGKIRRADTKGLVYVFELVGGDEIHVEAEETPGRIEYAPTRRQSSITNWDLEVELVYPAPGRPSPVL